jgi:hypothetical protein
MRVTVIIPNWNGRAHLAECLDSLRAQTYRNFSIVVVDNASSDDSVAWLGAHAADVDVIRMPTNGGFSSAVNAGIRASTSELVCLLNNDTAADPGWLGALVDALDDVRDADVVASCMVFYDDPTRINAAGDRFVLPLLEARCRGMGEDVERHGVRRRVFGASAGAALYRRSLFDVIGLFDEDFFLMSEDTDINLRALLAGRGCIYEPRARVRHKVSATIKTRGEDANYMLAVRNHMLVVAKDFPLPLLPLVTLCFPWRVLRSTVVVRPGSLPSGLRNLRRLPRRFAAELDGWRLGWSKRKSVVRDVDVGALDVLSVLLDGAGKALPS